MLTTVLAISAASWGVVMALAPLLQLRRMLRQHSADDVSVGYLSLLMPGFILWIAYGTAISDIALIVPNSVSALVTGVTIAIAVRYRRKSRTLDESFKTPAGAG